MASQFILVTAVVGDGDLASDLLIALEFLKWVPCWAHLVHWLWTVTVTFHVFGNAAPMVLLCLLDYHLVLLWAIQAVRVVLHHAVLLSDHIRRVFLSISLHGRAKIVLLASREFAVLRHVDRVLVEGRLQHELRVFNSNRRSTINIWIFKTGLGSRNRILGSWVTDVGAQRAWRLVVRVHRVFLQVLVLLLMLCHIHFVFIIPLTN